MEATVNQTAANEVMDERIVKLNEIASVKMSAISKNKRPNARVARQEAKLILEHWDDLYQLEVFSKDFIMPETVEILNSRIQNFIDAKNACEKAVEELEAPKAEVKLTDKEQSALEFFVRAMDGEEGFLMEDVEKEGKQIAGISPKSLKGLSSSLQKKGILEMYNGESYFDGAVTELGMKIYDRLVAEATAEAPKKEEPKKEAKKADKEPKAIKTSGHKVGDVHKNGKGVWTEYAPGKFDWRTIPSKKQKTGAKPKNTEDKKETKKADKKQDAKKVEKASKGNAKQTKKAEPKKESPEAPKQLTIDEWVALPTKAARGNKKPTEAQKQAFKLIMKGYRITSDKKFFEKEDDRKSCNWESVVAMFKRYGIDYIPEGLVK